jgi:S1-C subfamily serine protease
MTPARLPALLALLSASSLAQDSVPDMLERGMPAVVTVGLRHSSETMEGAGFVAADTAYGKVLRLVNIESAGSGFVIERGGKKYVVTNAHVVQSASGPGAIVAYSINQTNYAMHIAGLDSLYDIALLGFEDGAPGAEVSALQFRKGEARVGETVYAIGNPLSKFPYTVTQGMIGGKHRRFPDLTGRFGYLQSSATLTWGNSGGPLLDGAGLVIGVNTKIELHPVGGQVFQQPQLNFALEGGIAARLVDDLLANGGHLRRAYLGLVITEDVDQNQPSATTPVLSGVVPGSPAAGMLAGKLGFKILQIGRTEIDSADDALEAFEQARPGDEIRIEIGDPKSDKIEVVKIPAAELTDENAAALGKFLFEKKGGAELAEKDGSMRLNRPADRKPDANVSWVSIDLLKSRPGGHPQRPAGELQIVAAGTIGADNENARLYRVRNARDLGVAAKLAAMSGAVDCVYATKDGAEPGAVRLALSGKPDVTRRTLLY